MLRSYLSATKWLPFIQPSYDKSHFNEITMVTVSYLTNKLNQICIKQGYSNNILQLDISLHMQTLLRLRVDQSLLVILNVT